MVNFTNINFTQKKKNGTPFFGGSRSQKHSLGTHWWSSHNPFKSPHRMHNPLLMDHLVDLSRFCRFCCCMLNREKEKIGRFYTPAKTNSFPSFPLKIGCLEDDSVPFLLFVKVEFGFWWIPLELILMALEICVPRKTMGPPIPFP